MLPVAAVAWVLLLATEWFPNGLAPVDTASKALSARSCAVCHEQVHGEWQASRHGLAWTNAIFQREYRDKPLDWCVHCHAPLPEQREQIHQGGGALANEGVTCVVCHMREGRMQARTHAPASPHNTVVSADFGGPQFCGGCHQFNFPIVERGSGSAHVRRYTNQPMQDTQHQHARGPRAQQACLQCHGSLGHRFPGGHDVAFLAQALTLTTCRDGSRLRVVLANAGAGHNVPTGDVHRHLVLRVWPVDAPEKLQEVVFGRRFSGDESGRKRLLSDTTIPAGESRSARFAWAHDLNPQLRLQLRLVYTIDEFPFRGRELSEPTWATMVEREVNGGEVEKCQ